MKNKEIKDIKLVSSLIASGEQYIDYIYNTEENMVTFIFNNTEELEKKIDDFYSNNLEVEASKLLKIFTGLKSFIWKLSNGNRI